MLLGGFVALPALATIAALGSLSASAGLFGWLLVLLTWCARRRAPCAPLLARTGRLGRERALLRTAKKQFLGLQRAWDAGDLDALRRLTTETMFDELCSQLSERGVGGNRTDVLALEAHLISRESIGALEMGSIEFSGVVRESAQGAAAPFREVWILVRQGTERHWRLACQQALI